MIPTLETQLAHEQSGRRSAGPTINGRKWSANWRRSRLDAEQEPDKALASRWRPRNGCGRSWPPRWLRRLRTPGTAMHGSKAARAATDGDLDRPGHIITKPYSAASIAIR